MKATGLNQIDLQRQRVIQIGRQPARIEKISAGVEVDQEVDIALRSAIARCHRTEHSNVPATVQGGKPQYLTEPSGRVFTLPGFRPRCTMFFAELIGGDSDDDIAAKAQWGTADEGEYG